MHLPTERIAIWLLEPQSNKEIPTQNQQKTTNKKQSFAKGCRKPGGGEIFLFSKDEKDKVVLWLSEPGTELPLQGVPASGEQGTPGTLMARKQQNLCQGENRKQQPWRKAALSLLHPVLAEYKIVTKMDGSKFRN